MNYRHIFHAGNFADVVKHVALIGLLEALQRKDTPCCYLDVHAGIGLYRLGSDAAARSGEHLGGIGRLLTAERLPELLERYLGLVRACNDGERIALYPGSPSLALALLRPQDRAVLVELHPDDAETLKQRFLSDRRAAVHHMDAYSAMKAFIPPKERRGLVLVDPPFEQPGEFQRMVEATAEVHRRWPGGIYALWYPLKDRREVHRFHAQLVKSGVRRQLLIEFLLHPERPDGRLAGSGMVVVNPPWQFEERLRPALERLCELLGDERPAALRLEWLVPE